VEFTPYLTAAEAAKQRLEQFVDKVIYPYDEQAWGFYTYLLKQTKKYKLPEDVPRPDNLVSDDKSKETNP